MVFGIALYHAGLARLVIWLNRRSPKVLLYHACETSESDFIRGLQSNTTPQAFQQHLGLLQDRYRVIPLAQLEEGPIPERAVVITFDDAYRSVYDAAFPLLRAHGMPATVYVVTSVLDSRRLVWVNALAWLLNRHSEICTPIIQRTLRPAPAHSTRDFIIFAQEHFDSAVIESMLAEMWERTGATYADVVTDGHPYLRLDQIRELASLGWSFGSHTANHPNLRCIDEPERRAELDSALRAITQIGGRPSLAYPFGEFDLDARRLAVSLGHTSVMEVWGVNTPLRLPQVARIPVTAESRAGLFAEMEVVTPILAYAKRLAKRGAA